MNGIGSSITRIPIALYTATHMCALMLTPAQIDVQMADATFCKTSVVIKNYQSSEIFSRGLSESRRRALLVCYTAKARVFLFTISDMEQIIHILNENYSRVNKQCHYYMFNFVTIPII